MAKLGLSLGVVAVLLVLVEAAARTRQYMRYGTFGQILELETDEAAGLDTPTPGRSTDRITINSLGFRGEEIAPPSDDVIRIAFLGASTTYCAEVSSDRATWPSLVTAALNERYAPQRFDHINGGVPGYRVSESHRNLLQRIAPHEPDVVIIYHATNDLTSNSRRAAQVQGVYKGHADKTSWLGDRSLAWYLVEKNLLLRARTRAAREDVERLEVKADVLAKPFEDELTILVEDAKQHAERVCLISFSHRARREQTTEELFAACITSLYYMPYMTPEGLLESFAAYNAVIRRVAEASGSLLIEAEHALPGDAEHFADSVHMTDQGAQAFAEVVLDGLSKDKPFLDLFRP